MLWQPVVLCIPKWLKRRAYLVEPGANTFIHAMKLHSVVVSVFFSFWYGNNTCFHIMASQSLCRIQLIHLRRWEFILHYILVWFNGTLRISHTLVDGWNNTKPHSHPSPGLPALNTGRTTLFVHQLVVTFITTVNYASSLAQLIRT